MDPSQPTVRAASLVYGEEVPLDDPAEIFHEASRLSPSQLAMQVRGVRALEFNEELRLSATRAVKRRPGAPVTGLPEPAPLKGTLDELVSGRRSQRAFGEAPITLPELSALLRAGYGITSGENAPDQPRFRSVPSGGGLYPLDLYCAAGTVTGLRGGIYHYDPLHHSLARLSASALPSLSEALIPPELGREAALVVVVSVTFWRSRFKYGLRGYRFALLEAGHLAQNILLAATSLGLASVPVGGFFDAQLDRLLGLDGLYEASLYAISVGRQPGEAV